MDDIRLLTEEIEKEIAWVYKRLDKMAIDHSYLGDAPVKLKAYLAGLEKVKSIIEDKESKEIGWILNP